MTQPTIYLRRPPDWEEHEKPALPGSPAMPYHPPWERACYALVAILIGLTGSLGNALFTANLPTIQGQMGLTAYEAAWLTGAYVTFNVTANLLVYKFRQQYGMRLFTEIGLGAYALLSVLHLILGSPTSLLLLRAASGLAAAACTSLGTLYMLQALPRQYVLKLLVIGMGMTQLATPLAWIASPSLLNHGQWSNLYLFEAGLALLSFAAVVLLKLPTGVQIKAFEKLDLLTVALLIPGVGLLVAVLVQGVNRWWTDSPSLAWLLIGAIVLLCSGLYLEHHRKNPMLQTRWYMQSATMRFIVGAVILRFLTTEQSFGMVGMLRMLGMSVDQMQPLYVVIFLGTLIGLLGSALTFGIDNLRKQIITAIVLIAAATLLDFNRTSLDRPADFFLSQFLLAAGSGIFMGPLMLLGISQALKNGPSHMLTAILTISMTQTLGGIAGAAALNTYQQYREQAYSVDIVQKLHGANPQVAQRLQLQQQTLASQITDPTLRAAQASAQLSATVRREANVMAYNDVFHVVALVAFLYLLLSLWEARQANKAATQAAIKAQREAVQNRTEVGTDAANEEPDTPTPSTATTEPYASSPTAQNRTTT